MVTMKRKKMLLVEVLWLWLWWPQLLQTLFVITVEYLNYYFEINDNNNKKINWN